MSSTISNDIPVVFEGAQLKVVSSFEDFDESVCDKMHKTLKSLLSVRGKLPLLEFASLDKLTVKLQDTFAKLDSEIYLFNDTLRVIELLENSILVPLTVDTNLDLVIEALLGLNDLLLTSESANTITKTAFKKNVDRIVLLCGGQFRFAVSTYLTGLENKLAEDEQVKRVQKFINSITQLLQNLLVKNVMNLSGDISLDSLTELMHNLMHLWYHNEASTGVLRFKSISLVTIYSLVSNIFAMQHQDESFVSSVRKNLKKTVLRSMPDLILGSAEEYKSKVKQIHQSIDALIDLSQNYLHYWDNPSVSTIVEPTLSTESIKVSNSETSNPSEHDTSISDSNVVFDTDKVPAEVDVPAEVEVANEIEVSTEDEVTAEVEVPTEVDVPIEFEVLATETLKVCEATAEAPFVEHKDDIQVEIPAQNETPVEVPDQIEVPAQKLSEAIESATEPKASVKETIPEHTAVEEAQAEVPVQVDAPVQDGSNSIEASAEPSNNNEEEVPKTSRNKPAPKTKQSKEVKSGVKKRKTKMHFWLKLW